MTAPQPNAFISAGQIVALDTQHRDTRRRITEKLSWALQTRNVAVLIGAGASYHLTDLRVRNISVGQLTEMANHFGEDLDEVDIELLRRVCGEAASQLDLEQLLSDLSTAIRFASSPYARGEMDADADALAILRAKVNHILALACDLPAPSSDGYAALSAHRLFLSRLLARRRGDLPRLRLFTTNYDLTIEKSLDALGVDYVDGFIGTIDRALRLDVYARELYLSAASLGERRPRRLADFLYLYKIHGSINWRARAQASGSDRVVQVADYRRSTPEDLALIYPTPQKESDTLGYPYSDLLRAFGGIISEADTALITMGYGYADSHINRIITQSLASNATLAVVAVDPIGLLTTLGDECHVATTSNVGKFVAQADPRVSAITGPDARFERFAETYLPPTDIFEDKADSTGEGDAAL